MQPRLRRYVTAFMLVVALVLGWQRPPALGCAMGDPGCRDHCVLVVTSCTISCPAPVQPMPAGVTALRSESVEIAFSFELPVLDGLAVSPDTGPPRLST